MSIHPAYLEVFRDSFLANFIFTFSQDFAFHFIQFFERYNFDFAAIVAAVGSSIGFIFTFIIFYGFGFLTKKYMESGGNFLQIKKFVSRYLFFIMFLSFVPNFMILLPVFAGALRVNFTKFIIYIIIFRFIYYFSYLYIF